MNVDSMNFCGSAAAQCGEALPHRPLPTTNEATPLGEAQPRRRKSPGSGTVRHSLTALCGGKAAVLRITKSAGQVGRRLRGGAALRLRVVIFCLLLFAFCFLPSAFSAVAFGQDQKAPQPQPQQETGLAAISSYTKSIDQFTKRNPKKRRIFGNVAGVEDEQDRWREFKNARKIEQADEGDNLNERADVWLRDGKVVTAKFSFTSPSGDWDHYVNYYFRADGTLAKIHAQLNTFAGSDGGMGVVRDKFYAASGRLLHKSARYLDLKTQKPRKPGDFMDQPIPVYRTVRNLPFSKLL